MSLINPALLFGLGLAAIPVVLHFLLRAKPKKLLFPALRLVQVRRKRNVRRMRLRHLWLLLLRIAVIALIVLALARPSLPAANYAPNLREWLTLLFIGVVVAGSYFGLLAWWQKRRLPHHTLAYRRSLLRAGTGLTGLLLFLLLFAWPYQSRIAAEIKAPLPEVAENLPVAAVFLFDTSLSMSYRLENRTRLERAREVAGEHLSNLPGQSRVAVADTADHDPILFQADVAAAQSRIDSLTVTPIAVPIEERLRSALESQRADSQRTLDLQSAVAQDKRQDQFLREIYIFTDLAESAWSITPSPQLRTELEELEAVQVYLIDVGVEQSVNVGVTSLELSRQTLPLGGLLTVEASIEAAGVAETERTVELHVQDEAGRLVKQGQSSATVDADAGAQVKFQTPVRIAPLTQGEIRLSSSDPYSADDVRYFTVAVRPPPEILIVGETRGEVDDWLDALAPAELRRQGKARYRPTFATPSELLQLDLTKFTNVCLIDVRAPTPDMWTELRAYVESGGGLAVMLGSSKIDPVAYNSETAGDILPAELAGYVAFRPPEFIDLREATHPMLERFSDFGGFAELTAVDVNRCWSVEALPGGSVLARYTHWRQLPALLERPVGEGRVVMLTTSVDMTPRDGKPPWSDLPLAGWPYVALADQMMHYLGRQSASRFNYLAGEEVTLHLDGRDSMQRYLLRKPGLQQLRRDVPAGARTIMIDDADEIGHYEVVSSEEGVQFESGFSANPPPQESDFTRATLEQLDERLGEGRYEIARSIDELERQVEYGRIGRELFPFMVFFLIAVFCFEHLTANYFYEAEQSPNSTPSEERQ